MTLGDLLHSHAVRTPDAPALTVGERTMSFAALDASTDKLAAWLHSEGLKPGDRFAVQWPNGFEVVQLYFAAAKAGLIAVPINLRLKPSEIAWVIENSGSTLGFAHPMFAEAMQATHARVLTALPDLTSVAPLAQPLGSADMPGVIMYTSGSTGRPKGAVLTQKALLATGEICAQMVDNYGSGIKARGLLMTPLMHSSGMFVLLASMQRGEPCVLLPTFDPGAVLDAVEQHRCTTTLTLPAMMQFVLEEQAKKPRDASSLRVIFAGGDSVPVALQERTRQLMGVTMAEGLAQTETGPTICNPRINPKLGSLGVPNPSVELRIVDVVTQQEMPVGEPGELLVRSPAVCSEYWQNPQATAEALRGGWFHTGDLVSRDADGYYWFRGRLKEIIIRGGSNISPQEVEEALYTHPAVLEAGVIGKPHDVWGEVVLAVVALREGMSATEIELREHARKTLADYKVPEHIHFMPALPKGATGKVHRKALREALGSAG